MQVQNLAYPANLSDPLLLDWVKYADNPVLVPPPGILPKDFRDPTTAWITRDGKWRVAIGSKINTTGITLLYETTDFTSFELLDGVMHAVPGTGMWECVDFFPVSTSEENGWTRRPMGRVLSTCSRQAWMMKRRIIMQLGLMIRSITRGRPTTQSWMWVSGCGWIMGCTMHQRHFMTRTSIGGSRGVGWRN